MRKSKAAVAYTLALQAERKGGPDAGFVANVIMNQHRNAARKLRGLVALCNGGHDVRTAQFDLDVLIVDGEQKPWSYLEQEHTAAGSSK